MIIFRVTTGRSFTKFPTSAKEGVQFSKPLQFARTAEIESSSFSLQSGVGLGSVGGGGGAPRKEEGVDSDLDVREKAVV